MIDAFEAAAGQVKAETEGEQRIAGSYQVREAELAAWRSWWQTALNCVDAARRRANALLLQGLYAKMVDAFKKMGLEVVPGVGTPFDPEVSVWGAGWHRMQLYHVHCPGT